MLKQAFLLYNTMFVEQSQVHFILAFLFYDIFFDCSIMLDFALENVRHNWTGKKVAFWHFQKSHFCVEYSTINLIS